MDHLEENILKFISYFLCFKPEQENSSKESKEICEICSLYGQSTLSAQTVFRSNSAETTMNSAGSSSFKMDSFRERKVSWSKFSAAKELDNSVSTVPTFKGRLS